MIGNTIILKETGKRRTVLTNEKFANFTLVYFSLMQDFYGMLGTLTSSFLFWYTGVAVETEIKSTSATPFLYVMQQEIKKGIHDNAKINKRMKHEMCY